MDAEFANSSRAGPRRPEHAPPPAEWSTPWMPGPAVAAAEAMVRPDPRDRMVSEAEAQRVAYEERLRVAREIHDVVGHGLAVINLQAGIALHVVDRRPDQAVVALEAVKTASKSALEELRSVLAVVRRQDTATRTPPPGGLDRLDALVEELNACGMPVRLEVRGEPAALPGAVDLAAYRIVQESLTNVLRHARPAAAAVRVAFEPGAVSLEIVNDASENVADADGGRGVHGHTDKAHTDRAHNRNGHNGNGRGSNSRGDSGNTGNGHASNGHASNGQAGSGPPDSGSAAYLRDGHGHVAAVPGGGHGINGMRERTAALGGSFEAGPRPGGGFRVGAWLPVGTRPPDQARPEAISHHTTRSDPIESGSHPCS